MPYCVDCEHYSPAMYTDFGMMRQEDCNHPHWIISEKCHPTMRKKREYTNWEIRRPSTHNAKCDCELYERKWWKLWR